MPLLKVPESAALLSNLEGADAECQGKRQALNIYKDTHFPPLEELFLVGYWG